MRGNARLARQAIHVLQTTKRPLALVLASALMLQTTSCGTLIHPDRVGQPRTGPLDPSVVILDGLGVLLFVIPGIVAFVVDFSTGAIYLPGPAYYPAPYPAPVGYPPAGPYPPPGAVPPPGGPVPMTRIDNDPTTLNKDRIQAIVRAQTGRDIDLDGPDLRVQRVQNVDTATRALHEAREPSIVDGDAHRP